MPSTMTPARLGPTPWRRRQPATAFGILLEQYRRRADLSQTTLADRAGVDRTYLSRVRSGDRTPSLAVLARLADALELDDGDRALLAIAAMREVA